MNQHVDFAQPFDGTFNTTAYLVQFILKEKSAFLDDDTKHSIPHEKKVTFRLTCLQVISNNLLRYYVNKFCKRKRK